MSLKNDMFNESVCSGEIFWFDVLVALYVLQPPKGHICAQTTGECVCYAIDKIGWIHVCLVYVS